MIETIKIFFYDEFVIKKKYYDMKTIRHNAPPF